ncbi:MAG: hypothetical protein ABGY95_00390 [Rubritalea sp.]|uniref:hypothetical protein n=1 Tax=Rubritalea sp. TaxID=2109375 RepID=UPI00324268E4
MYTRFSIKTPILLGLLAATVAFSSYAHAEEKKKASAGLPTVNVADTLKGKLQILDGDKYSPTKVNQKITHYIVYYTASW